jgi:Icc-related predicted phosphoesterase
MMRIAFISDIHNEFIRHDKSLGGPEAVPDIYLAGQKIDVLVLAGDIDHGLAGAEWAVRQAERLRAPVVYVLGNHEHYTYDGEMPLLNGMKAISKGTHVHILENETVVLNNTQFIGGTLWTDYALFGRDSVSEAMLEAAFNMNDFSQIRMMTRSEFYRLTPEYLLNCHQQTLRYIKETLEQPYQGKRVVVTHHAPLPSCLPDDRQHDLLGASYASDLQETIAHYQPDLWLYGHIHTTINQRQGKTQILAQPRGYPNLQPMPNIGYEPMVVEI